MALMITVTSVLEKPCFISTKRRSENPVDSLVPSHMIGLGGQMRTIGRLTMYEGYV